MNTTDAIRRGMTVLAVAALISGTLLTAHADYSFEAAVSVPGVLAHAASSARQIQPTVAARVESPKRPLTGPAIRDSQGEGATATVSSSAGTSHSRRAGNTDPSSASSDNAAAAGETLPNGIGAIRSGGAGTSKNIAWNSAGVAGDLRAPAATARYAAADRPEPTRHLDESKENADVIWDMIGELATPPSGRQQISIFKDFHFGAGTGCLFDYKVGGTPSATLSILNTRRDVVRYFNRVPWHLTNWHWQSPTERVLSQNLPSLCSTDAKAFAAGHNVGLKVSYLGASAATFEVQGQSVVLQLNSVPYYEKLFGGAFFPSRVNVTWPVLYVRDAFPARYLEDYSGMKFTFRATLQAAQINQMPVSTPGPAPDGASRTYDRRINGTRLLLGLPIRWLSKSCTHGKATGNDICREWYYRPLELLIFFYDERVEYFAGRRPLSHDRGKKRRVYKYRLSPQFMIPGRPAENPFKKIGTPALAQADLLPTLKSVILDARAQGDADGIDYVPPRRVINGIPETDDQYLANFAIDTVALGYENSGLANIQYKITDFKLVGIPK